MTKRLPNSGPPHPVQPLYKDDDGVIRFKQNAIVSFLAKTSLFDTNALELMPWSQEDWEQFYQLTGWSLSGLGDLILVSNETYDRAADQAIYGDDSPLDENCILTN